MDFAAFSSDVMDFVGSLGLSGLEESGLRFPLEDWDSCCHVCVWLSAMGHELPSHLVSRLVLGPMNPSVRLYCELMKFQRI